MHTCVCITYIEPGNDTQRQLLLEIYLLTPQYHVNTILSTWPSFKHWLLLPCPRIYVVSGNSLSSSTSSLIVRGLCECSVWGSWIFRKDLRIYKMWSIWVFDNNFLRHLKKILLTAKEQTKFTSPITATASRDSNRCVSNNVKFAGPWVTCQIDQIGLNPYWTAHSLPLSGSNNQ